MRTICVYFFLLLICPVLHCQSWQWGKRGGGIDELPFGPESIYSIVTDSEKNIYTLSKAAMTGLDVDGHPKAYYGDPTTKTDYIISSFSCDGTYRWSKVIGGGGDETIQRLQIDLNDNIYVSGRFSTCGTTIATPPRIENDVILSQNPMDCSLIFISKFDKNGNMIWFRRPQLSTVSFDVGFSQTDSRGLRVDSSGNCYWLVSIPPGTYADGAFVNDIQGSNWFIFKYNSSGVFESAVHLDIQTTFSSGQLDFYRNPYDGKFYIIGYLFFDGSAATVGGIDMTHSFYLAAFDTDGTFLYTREDTNNEFYGGFKVHNLDFDSSNNIYLGGIFAGFNLDSFLGYTIPESTVTAYVMKLNPAGSTILWVSHHNKSSENGGAILYDTNTNSLLFTQYCGGNDFTWGSQTLNANSDGTGNEVLLAIFDATSGECTKLDRIVGAVGNNIGTALAVDVSGDIIVGGQFTQQITLNDNTTLVNDGQQTDFFVAKYAMEPCSPLSSKEFGSDEIEFYPNPVKNRLVLSIGETLEYGLYDTSSRLIKKGVVSPASPILDMSGLQNGTYLLKLYNNRGENKTMKLLKQ